MAPSFFAESSIEAFSRDLNLIALRFPDRFAHLALKFPSNVHPLYLNAILNAVIDTKPKIVLEKEENENWYPVNYKTIEAISKHFPLENEINVASSFCWLIRNRAKEFWSKSTINQLVKYAQTHFDPKPDKLNIYSSSKDGSCNNASISDLEQNALNSVRGIAALAIGAFLWEHPGRISEVQAGIESLVKDPHSAVRIAAIEICLSLLNINKDLAIEYFVDICEKDVRIAASKRAQDIFNYGIKSHYEQLSPIILSMLKDSREEVAELGAVEVCAGWIFYGFFKKELFKCEKEGCTQIIIKVFLKITKKWTFFGKLCSSFIAKNTCAFHRKGIAIAAAQCFQEKQCLSKCYELLLPLFNDENINVRKETNAVFRKKNVLTLDNMPKITLNYIKTKAFLDDPGSLLLAFKDYHDSLFPYADVILNISKIFADSLSEKSRNISTSIAYDVRLLMSLILRLYEQAQNEKHIQKQCLDILDLLFEKRVGNSLDLLQNIEK